MDCHSGTRLESEGVASYTLKLCRHGRKTLPSFWRDDAVTDWDGALRQTPRTAGHVARSVADTAKRGVSGTILLISFGTYCADRPRRQESLPTQTRRDAGATRAF